MRVWHTGPATGEEDQVVKDRRVRSRLSEYYEEAPIRTRQRVMPSKDMFLGYQGLVREHAPRSDHADSPRWSNINIVDSFQWS